MQPNENLVETEFLSFFLKGEEMRKKYVYHSQQGASIVRRNLNKVELLQDKVLIPPISEQRKIAEILSELDKNIYFIKNILKNKLRVKNPKVLYGGSVNSKNVKNYYRPLEVDTLLGNSSKAKKELKWKISYNLKSMIKEMVNEELVSLKNDKKYR